MINYVYTVSSWLGFYDKLLVSLWIFMTLKRKKGRIRNEIKVLNVKLKLF